MSLAPPYFTAASRVKFKCRLAPLFVSWHGSLLSALKCLRIDVILSSSFSLSKKDTNSNERAQVRKFLFQLCFVRAQKPPLPTITLLHSTHLYIWVFSPSSDIKVKRVFGLPSEYKKTQTLDGLKYATNEKFMFRNLLQAVCVSFHQNCSLTGWR